MERTPATSRPDSFWRSLLSASDPDRDWGSLLIRGKANTRYHGE